MKKRVEYTFKSGNGEHLKVGNRFEDEDIVGTM